MGGEFISEVLSLKLNPPYPLPHLKNALWMANTLGSKIVDGFCRTLKPGGLSKLIKTDLRETVIRGEDLLRARKGHCAHLPSEQQTIIRGMLSVRTVLFLLGRLDVLGKAEMDKCTSLEAIAQASRLS